MSGERETERALRDDLAAHAGETDTAGRVVGRIRDDVQQRRRTRWSVVGVAAAVALIAGGVATVTLGADEDGRLQDPTVADSPDAIDGAWRTEYWGDVAVDVPADWGYGGAPDATGTACYPEAMIGPDGQNVDGGRGYVGRPIVGSDVCALVPKAWEPAAPYVWLGAALEPGSYEYDNGYVQETIEVNGSTVTVGTTDAALRRRILATVRGGGLCLSEIETEGPIAHDGTQEADAGATSLRVCVYQADDGRERASAHLAYAAELGARAVRDYEAALAGADHGGRDGCPTASVVWDTWVVLELVADDGSVVRQDVAQTVCWLAIEVDAQRLWGRSERTVSLSPALVAPWASAGIRATVHGTAMIGGTDWLTDYFIGPQG